MSPESVECHSGYTYGERPVALHWQGRRLNVQQIEARWRSPGGIGFRVRTEDGQVFELFYAGQPDEWQIRQP
jgi:hypothetical protein